MADQYDDRGKTSIWKNESDNPKAPAHKGTVTAHRDIKEGETVEIALWPNRSDNERAPVMRGRISDRRPRDGEQSQSSEDGFDDDIPF